MNRFFTLLLAASCLTAVGQDTTMVCGYGITSQGGGISSWPYADIFIPSNQKAVTIYADFYRPQSSGSALDFSAAYCAGCSESDLLDWSPPYPNFFLWNYDTIPFPMYGAELLFDTISNSEVIGPGYLRILAPLTSVNDEWSDLCIGFLELSGCMDNQACNYSEEILISNPESCDYSCCPGPGCCDNGMFWDWELSMCQITNPSDSNFDGCVQLNDLLDLLGAYGNCSAEESPWQCGDPLEYHGYDYETVQIGEQCWFAENLRVDNYRNGDAIATTTEFNEWYLATNGLVTIHEAFTTTEDGRFYNWYAVDDLRGLCPTNWHVPLHEEHSSLLNQVSYDASQLQTTEGWDAGTNQSGFSGEPNGGYFFDLSDQTLGHSLLNEEAYWWSASPDIYAGSALRAMALCMQKPEYLIQPASFKQTGYSVRCIKDAE